MSVKIAKHSVSHEAKNHVANQKPDILLTTQIWYIIVGHLGTKCFESPSCNAGVFVTGCVFKSPQTDVVGGGVGSGGSVKSS